MIKIVPRWFWQALILIGCFLLATQWYFQPNFLYTHDGENHLARFANYKIALKEGQFPPRFAPNLFNHYGFPVFNFNYPLANILSVPFSVLDVSYEITFKLLALASLAFGMWGMWQLSTKIVSSKYASLISTIAYATSGHWLSLVLYRGNIGEMIIYGLLPHLLVFVLDTKIGKFFSWNFIWYVAIWSAFFLAHNVSALIFTPILIAGVAIKYFQKRDLRNLLQQASICVLAFMLSCWFWIPALLEKSHTVLASANINTHSSLHALSFMQAIFQPLSFGFSYPGFVDSLGIGLGVLLGSGLLLSGILVVSKFRHIPGVQMICIALSFGLLFLETSPGARILDILPFGSFVQFPWRFQALLSITASISLGLVFYHARYWLKVLLVLLIAGHLFGIGYLKPVDTFHRQTIDYDLFSQSTTTQNENRAKDFTYTNIADWQPQPNILSGDGTHSVSHWTGTTRNYEITATTPVTVSEPTMYFPGWKTTANGNEIEYTNSNEIAGRIAYQLEPGEYEITTRFTQNTFPRMLGHTITGLGFGILVIGFMKNRYETF